MDSYIFKGIIIKNQRNEQVFMEVIDLLYEDKIKYESLQLSQINPPDSNQQKEQPNNHYKRQGMHIQQEKLYYNILNKEFTFRMYNKLEPESDYSKYVKVELYTLHEMSQNFIFDLIDKFNVYMKQLMAKMNSRMYPSSLTNNILQKMRAQFQYEISQLLVKYNDFSIDLIAAEETRLKQLQKNLSIVFWIFMVVSILLIVVLNFEG